MKFIITENKLNQLIIDFINESYDVNNINWTYGTDDYGDEVDYAALFYLGDFGDDEDLFRWYGENYWYSYDMESHNKEMIEKWKEESPTLDFEDEETYDILTGYFGDKWHQPFKEWFMKNFGFPIKTIKK